MKIAVVNTHVPYIYGGAEFLADNLVKKLNQHGHNAVLIKIPFQWNPPQEIINHMHAARLLHFESYFDLVIPLKFPAYHIRHSNKVLWLLHQFRQVYDLWGTPFQGIPSTSEGLRLKNNIIKHDNLYLREAKKIFTNSNITSDRLKRFNGFDSEVLYPPLMDAENFHCEEYGDFLFYPSRINGAKRQNLAIESMRYIKSKVKLLIAGNPESEHDMKQMQAQIHQYGLKDKVTIISQFISQEQKVNFFAKCLGCLYIPFHEDSYGYVTLEAYHSQKPVITCTDSGGTDVLVKDHLTGFVVPPEPQAIAEAMDKFYINKKRTEEMGKLGLEHIRSLNISWENVVRRLTE
ncbi:glycosyltransferase family 4 protein [Neobacillus muris]|uniref:glycosyltransferase family 4 protein n=1 Tax=Neobacillus muris TaxID=2941334 RepID=UPI00203BF9EB|nr:glycosyltransferase family 4 protein [Neobacillus muris]